MWFGIYKKEIKSYLQSPVIYALAGIFLFLMAYFTLGMIVEFADIYRDFNMRRMYGMDEMNVTQWVIRGFFSLLNFLLLFLIPVLTMRLLAEERKNRTFEILTSCPISDGDIVFGKYLAALTLILALLLASLVYPLLVERFSQPEWPVILTGYLGLVLTVLAYLAFGLFASTVTENQIIASFLSFSGLVFFYLVGDVTSSKEGWLGKISSELSLRQHSLSFSNGVIELRDVFYLLAFAGFFLFLSLEILKIRRWKA
ncbi:ABC transporter permease subunit [Candidatus Sumerlaeota bacterium]|nr:ABC transporter permease subunit [Candidatus Sumerlaeota bacterium]